MIRRVVIRNYRLFREFDIALAPGVNTIVGANETGKSTVIEAINLALTGRLHGRSFLQELSPYLVNLEETREYIRKLRSGERATPPPIIIEVFLEVTDETAPLQGDNNLLGEPDCGVRIQAALAGEHAGAYFDFIDSFPEIRLVPTEYYEVKWLGFHGREINARSVPANASVIDPSTIRLSSGVDYHLQHLIRKHLASTERAELSREYRMLRESFSHRPAVTAANKKLQGEEHPITDKSLTLAIDISQGYSWENSIAAHINDVPFQYIGRGEQNIVKTLLAIGQRALGAHMVLIEEPETHLTFAALRQLIKRIEERCEGKQVVIATHSAYVINKLGLGSLILLGDGAVSRIDNLPKGTIEFFQRLPGFDTLRLVLARSAILVEGPSDELIVQRCYLDEHGRLPIDDGIDVISVGTSHKRFLDIAMTIRRRAKVVIDNDGKAPSQIEERFKDYESHECVTLHFSDDVTCKSLEPQIVAANDLKTLNSALGLTCSSKEEVEAKMTDDKTASAMAIFESAVQINMPAYIRDACISA